jgi:hypothetical protein
MCNIHIGILMVHWWFAMALSFSWGNLGKDLKSFNYSSNWYIQFAKLWHTNILYYIFLLQIIDIFAQIMVILISL